ncbi:hypothetical protein [Anaerotignum sp.]|nr:hypothetical protein [Anaerotignum sp.]
MKWIIARVLRGAGVNGALTTEKKVPFRKMDSTSSHRGRGVED